MHGWSWRNHSDLNRRLPELWCCLRVEAEHHHGSSEESEKVEGGRGGREGAGVNVRGIWKGGQRAKRLGRRETWCAKLLCWLQRQCVFLLLLFGGQDEQPVPAAHCPYKPTPAQRGQDQREGQQQGDYSHSEQQRRGQGGFQSLLHAT